MTNDHAKIRADLFERADAAKGTRLRRVLTSPYGMIAPVVMRRLGMSRPVNVPTVWGGTFSGLLPEAVSTMIWRTGFFDRNVCLSLLKILRPGSTFIDVGAHFGFFSLFASHLVGRQGRIVSVEAMPSTFAYLEKNIHANKQYDNLTLHQGAAFSERKTLQFTDFGIVASSLNSAFGVRQKNSLLSKSPQEIKVEAAPLDDIVRPLNLARVDLVKIDAESSEKFVLAGMRQIIKAHRPAIILEVGDIGVVGGFASSELIDILRDEGYTPYRWVSRDNLAPFVADGPVPYANLLFQPAESEVQAGRD